MGYYSNIRIDLKIKPKARPKIRRIINQFNNTPNDNHEEWKHYFLYDIKIEDDGYITLDDYNRKFYHDDEFVLWLKDYCTKGTIQFVGEDGERWGYDFDGEGNVYELEYPPPKRGKKINVGDTR